MKQEKEEPLKSVILKAFSMIATLGAISNFVVFISLKSPGPSLLTGIACGGTAVSLWWMASVLTLLDRIAKNGTGHVTQPARRPEPKASGKPLMREIEEKASVPTYEL